MEVIDAFRQGHAVQGILDAMPYPQKKVAIALEFQLNERYGRVPCEYRRSFDQLLFALQNPTFGTTVYRSTGELLELALEFKDKNSTGDRVADLERHNCEVQNEDGYMSCACGSKRIVWDNRHMRSTDEGSTLFCVCRDCGSSWKKSA
jgi:DNA-directed RNA polymerase subunit M/transcription elongation factor TFIIS